MDLTTTYLGMKLRTPLVPSASPLSEDIDKIKQMEQAGASAVVLHSLFEEEAEAAAAARRDFLVGPKAYLEQIKRAKSVVKIPIIASLNCTTLGGWISYTRQIAEAGATRWNSTSIGYRLNRKLPAVQSKKHTSILFEPCERLPKSHWR
jgi:Dihydroorotate dehydrogenase